MVDDGRADGEGRDGADVGDGAADTAAHKAIDSDRLLDAEDPSTRHLDDVEHWISAYSELIAYKETLIAKTQEEAGTMVNPAALHETEKVDLTILKRELENFRRRLEYWLGRREELNA